ncbi:MAG: SH3 domain-containing protein [Lyngbya sp. HA4199-MV5]|jgi:hypothetical protein|nr:SH3 domain-containing protein [Lyngbya sp. HA4199-MV5]
MLETRANQNSESLLREGSLRNISAKKKTFSEKIAIAEGVSSKLKTSIKDYDNILNVFQVEVGLNKVEKYVETVDIVISKYKGLDQEVQTALREGRQVIMNLAVLSQSPEAVVSPPTLGSDAFVERDQSRFGVIQIRLPGENIVNLRATPNGEIIGRLQNGTYVTLGELSSDTKWQQITTQNGKSGWVWAEFVQYDR